MRCCVLGYGLSAPFPVKKFGEETGGLGMLFGLHPIEIVFTLLLALLVFGPHKLPEIARSLGEAMREFRRSTSETAGETPGESIAPATVARPESDNAAG